MVTMMTAKVFEWASFMQAIDMFSEDFMENGRNDEIKDASQGNKKKDGDYHLYYNDCRRR